MYVIVRHELIDPPAAFARGERLKRGEGAPRGAQALQFFPSEDGSDRHVPLGGALGRRGPVVRRRASSVRRA